MLSNLYIFFFRFIPVEDAYATGYCATKIGIHPPHHDNRFENSLFVNISKNTNNTFNNTLVD